MPTRIPHHVRVYNLAYSGSNYRWESVENILGLEKYLWEFGKALVIQASASFEQRSYRISLFSVVLVQHVTLRKVIISCRNF